LGGFFAKPKQQSMMGKGVGKEVRKHSIEGKKPRPSQWRERENHLTRNAAMVPPVPWGREKKKKKDRSTALRNSGGQVTWK